MSAFTFLLFVMGLSSVMEAATVPGAEADASACAESMGENLLLHSKGLTTGGVAEKLSLDQADTGIWSLWVAAYAAAALWQILAHMDPGCLRVFCWGMLTCVTTGLGALPFAFTSAASLGDRALALANAAAGGMMLSASVGMLVEAHEHAGPFDWQLLAGLLAGGAFIRLTELLHPGHDGSEEDSDAALLHTVLMDRRHFRKARLIFIVMFCHSAAEGIAVGVAFSRQLTANFGLFVSLLLAVHNMPEGLAVSLVLVPRGVSARMASVVATLTSIPQPFMAVVAYLFVDTFQCLLPLGLAFAAGAMAYVCFCELLPEAAEQIGARTSALWTIASFALMSAIIVSLHSLTADAH